VKEYSLWAAREGTQRPTHTQQIQKRERQMKEEGKNRQALDCGTGLHVVRDIQIEGVLGKGIKKEGNREKKSRRQKEESEKVKI
jgi:hypothetical protein